MTPDCRFRDGRIEFRRYAYVHRRGIRYGLLEAVSHADATRHLGRTYFCRTVWINGDDFEHDQDVVRAIVKRTFPNIVLAEPTDGDGDDEYDDMERIPFLGG